jgi:hypothetical protein
MESTHSLEASNVALQSLLVQQPVQQRRRKTANSGDTQRTPNPGMKHAEDVSEHWRTCSSVSRMRYSHQMFAPHLGSSFSTGGLSRMYHRHSDDLYSNCTATVITRFLTAPLVIFPLENFFRPWEVSAFLHSFLKMIKRMAYTSEEGKFFVGRSDEVGQKAAGSVSPSSGDNQATGRSIPSTQALTSVVFPKPAEEEIRVSLPCSPSFRRSSRRGRLTAFGRSRGRYSFVARIGVGIAQL